MGKEGKSLSASWREQNEPSPLPSVIMYTVAISISLARQWGASCSCVKFLCAGAKEPRYFTDRGAPIDPWTVSSPTRQCIPVAQQGAESSRPHVFSWRFFSRARALSGASENEARALEPEEKKILPSRGGHKKSEFDCGDGCGVGRLR